MDIPLAHAQDSDSSADSLDDEEMHNTAHPSAAFLLASQQRGTHDQYDEYGLVRRFECVERFSGHGRRGRRCTSTPFARASASVEDFDDSFDEVEPHGDEEGVEEDTVFGVPPAERAARRWVEPAKCVLMDVSECLARICCRIRLELARKWRWLGG